MATNKFLSIASITPTAIISTPAFFRDSASLMAGSLLSAGKGTPSEMKMHKFCTSGLSPFAAVKHCSLVTLNPSGVFLVWPRWARPRMAFFTDSFASQADEILIIIKIIFNIVMDVTKNLNNFILLIDG